MAEKRLIYFTADQVTSYRWKGGNLSIEEEGAASDRVVEIAKGLEFPNATVTTTGAPILLKGINDYLKGGMLTLGICLAYVLWAQGQGIPASQFVPVTMLVTAVMYGLPALVTFSLLKERAQPRARGGPGLRRDPGAGWFPRRATAGNPRGPTHPPRVRPWPATGRHATVRLPVRRWWGWCIRQRGVVICDVSIYTKVRRSRL
jgi:hypothetical protein